MHNRDRYPIRVDIEEIMEQLGISNKTRIDYIEEVKKRMSSCQNKFKPVYLSDESEKNE